ncbi:beta-sarcoglycan-like [Oscarella lobularis]|uniref:beta-sarcoglycan-like n=1 Tax=Oscarella lobularis TaxID=121494 RepID=UPI00331380AB
MTSKECWRSERPVRPEVKPRTERNFLSSYVPPVIATQAAMMHYRGQKSMHQKREERLQSKRVHEGNVTTGHVNTNEAMLHKSGLRGRKLTIFYVILFIIAILVVLNFVLTILILSVHRLTYNGLPSLYLRTDGSVIFPKDARFFDAWIGKFIGSYAGENLTVSNTANEQVRISVGMYDDSTRTHVILNGAPSSAVEFRNVLTVQHNGNWLARFDDVMNVRKLNVSKSVRKVPVESANTTLGVTSRSVRWNGPILNLTSDEHLLARRANAISVLTSNASLTAPAGNITVASQSTLITGRTGFTLKGLPEADASSADSPKGFKLCACLSAANVATFYRVPASAKGCMTAKDPCV